MDGKALIKKTAINKWHWLEGRSLTNVHETVSKGLTSPKSLFLNFQEIKMNNTFSSLRIVTLDDHDIILQGLNNSIENEHDLELVGSYRSSRDMMASLEQMKADVAIID